MFVLQAKGLHVFSFQPIKRKFRIPKRHPGSGINKRALFQDWHQGSILHQ
jgi:hypothetical protein